ncbi:uncharacterized protein STEHIDRAFT_122354 [Stereum hirsutum FP-91666 SS1]|uniref:uncharacterized protein n=1 Tax=Stereum hirsutum (strain FP-91666) TaxID=721885 RepID=UPI000444971B|nr:uncharacterized protein STEHIDRAFT_122354 [Stereum hirsutum FP-91666 SS1]EIM85440.1 hypothetical protein STEHIDRAFT_122354 [Stereum hirsutum FP-91666 SS1]
MSANDEAKRPMKHSLEFGVDGYDSICLIGDRCLILFVAPFSDPAYLRCPIPSLCQSRAMLLDASDVCGVTMGFWRLLVVDSKRWGCVDGDTDVGSPSRVRCFPVSYRPSSSGVYVVVETETTTSLLRDSEGRGMTPGSLG